MTKFAQILCKGIVEGVKKKPILIGKIFAPSYIATMKSYLVILGFGIFLIPSVLFATDVTQTDVFDNHSFIEFDNYVDYDLTIDFDTPWCSQDFVVSPSTDQIQNETSKTFEGIVEEVPHPCRGPPADS